jgi:peptide/nickel transport system ATP-binding protein
VGESGSGRTTVGRVAAARRRVGVIFQDPATSLDPRLTVADTIEEPLRVHRVGDRAGRRARVRELLDAVRLAGALAERRPAELSGGQRQRVALARALALQPRLLVADEPTSALDVSVQAAVLALFRELQAELGFATLFISHDLAVVDEVSARVLVLRGGREVESGPAGQVLRSPAAEYTRALVAAVPEPDPVRQRARRAAVAPARQS